MSFFHRPNSTDWVEWLLAATRVPRIVIEWKLHVVGGWIRGFYSMISQQKLGRGKWVGIADRDFSINSDAFNSSYGCGRGRYWMPPLSPHPLPIADAMLDGVLWWVENGTHISGWLQMHRWWFLLLWMMLLQYSVNGRRKSLVRRSGRWRLMVISAGGVFFAGPGSIRCTIQWRCGHERGWIMRKQGGIYLITRVLPIPTE